MANPARTPQPLSDLVAAEVDSSRSAVVPHQEKVLETRRSYSIRRVELVSTESSSVSNVVVDYYQLPHSNSPVVLLLPISGGEYEVESLFARYFAKHGLAVL